jgi:AbrB family looped-hinge helix DNA binding protein
MLSTTLSSKGQVVIPKELRDARQWHAGMSLTVEEVPLGLLIRPVRKPLFPVTTIDDVMGCLKYDGPPLSLAEIDRRMAVAFRKNWLKDNPNDKP